MKSFFNASTPGSDSVVGGLRLWQIADPVGEMVMEIGMKEV